MLLAFFHVLGQLERGLLYWHAAGAASGWEEFPVCADDKDCAERLWGVARLMAYRLCVEADGWTRFCAELHLDGEALLRDLPCYDTLRRTPAGCPSAGLDRGRGGRPPAAAEPGDNVSVPCLPKRARYSMGDSPHDPLRVDCDRHIKLEFHGAAVTSDAGLLAYRELDSLLGLTSTAASSLLDPRTGPNTQHGLLALLRQSLYSQLAGYEEVHTAERLCRNPAMPIVVGGRTKNQTAATARERARFETETLSSQENRKHRSDLCGKWIDQTPTHRRLTQLILDLDSSVSATYGHQQGSASNGPFGCTCSHALFLGGARQNSGSRRGRTS
jgi:hypothetical protein